MNIVDAVFIVLLILSAIWGFKKGAFSQIIAIAGAMVGLWVATQYGTQLSLQLFAQPGMTRGLMTLGIAALSVAFCYALATLFGDIVSRIAEDTWLGPVDRVGGFLMGIAQGALWIWIIAALLIYGPIMGIASAVQQSQIAATVQRIMPTPPEIIGRLTTFLDPRGFTQAYADVGAQVIPLELPTTPSIATVGLAESAGRASLARIEASGCQYVSIGSGVVIGEGRIVTNAHVVAGATEVKVNDVSGEHAASVVAFDPLRDVAVLDVPESKATVIPWTKDPVARGALGATLGFPAGSESVTVRPAGVREHLQAQGYDIYGQTVITRDILALSSGVRQGDSGGPMVLDDGTLAGIVFAGASTDNQVGYALTRQEVQPVIDRAGNDPVHTGACRY